MKRKAPSLLALFKRPAKAAVNARFDGRLEELEPRILFSADATALLVDPSATPAADLSGAIQQVLPPATPTQTQTPAAQTAQNTQSSTATVSTELVFVDARVPDAQTLMSQILAQQDGTRTLEIHWLSADRDGVAQITEVLQGRHDVSALHLISHGSDGNVQLGSTWLNEATLPGHLQELSSWQSALTANADILIYGCDVAQTAAGQHFVDDLSLLTGADVAASENKTGSASLGGDWKLEYADGHIDAQIAVSMQVQATWQGLLQASPQGSETLVNTTTSGTQNTTTNRQVAMDNSGNFVAIWNNSGSIKGQLFTAAGAKTGSEFTVASGNNAQVAMDDAGNFVVVWDSANTIYAQRYNAAGTAQGSAISVGTSIYPTAPVSNPSVAIDDSGNFVVAWQTADASFIANNIYFREYNSAGTALNSGTSVTSSAGTATTDPYVAMNGSGAFVVTWTDNSGNIYGQRYNSSRAAQGASFQVNTGTSGTQSLSSVSMDNSGNFVVVWSSTQNGTEDIFGQRYNSSGVKQGTEFQVNTTSTDVQTAPSVSTDIITGSFVVTWQSNLQDGSGTGVYLKQYDASGNAASASDQLVNTTTANAQGIPSVAIRNHYGAIIWNGNGTGDTAGVFAQRYIIDNAPVITSNGGGATASVGIPENTTAVTTVTATDADADTITYSISGGVDAAKFTINASTGVLSFISAPDYENPTDNGANNVYDLIVQVSDGTLTDTQVIAVTITDVSSALVVTTTADTNDSGLGTAFNAEQLNAANGGTDGKISLREALIAANNTPGTDTISFAITGATGSYGEYTITATSALPTITQAVNIDASTQGGYVAGGLHTVVLDGNDAAAYGLDLTNTADGSTIRGLVIRNFTSYGIYVESGSDNNTIVGNFIGSFNADGSNKGVGFGNATAGIITYGANTVIGGTTAADRNVISGNPGGYNIYMATGADGTVIKGNYIGLNAAGTSVFSSTNPNYGIMIETSSTNVTIGGTVAGSGNVISGHVREGIWVTTTGTVTIQGNYIGTDVTGTVDLGNTRYGIYLDDAGTATIGGTSAGAGNLISGNDLGGIYAANNGVTVLGNIIGLNATGTAKLANTGSGIELRTGGASTIGGNGSGYRNIISGNTSYGIDVETSYAHVIKGNYIGVGADGVTLLGNTLAGVYINATGTIVGGKTSGDGNIIAGNGGAGIVVAGGTGNLFYRNSIYSNTGIGIDLGNDGVTANDYNDADGGANYLTNYPVITSVVTNGTSTTITGSIDWYQGPDTIYIELYASPTKDPTGYGQGKTYLGAAQVTTASGTGDATFSLTVTGVSVGDWISAVANVETSFIGASEFAKAVQAVSPANAPRGRVIWNNNDRFYQSYADWSTAGFGGVGTDGLNFGDDISMITAAEAPTRNEILFIGSADASGQILAGIWNGSTWSSIISIPLASPSATAQMYDSFALAYDQISGDAMMVWDNGNTGTTGLSYATWNGTSWSAINTITAPISGEPVHMKLAANPIGHDMVLAVETTAASNNQYAVVWNGSSWGNAQTLGSNSNKQYFELNVAYEQHSGHAMVIYDNSAADSSSVQYRVWNGSSWGSEGTITAPAGVTAGSDLYNTAIASDPGSNRIAIAAKDAANETWLAVWNGSSWGSTLLATTSGVDTPDHHATMAVAFESQSGDLLAVYGKSAGPNVYYRTWTSGGGWSAEGTGPSVGGTDIPYISKLYADPYSNTIMLGVQDNAYDLNFVAWDGSAWGTVTELDNNTVFYYRENFTYVWFQNAPVIANLSGDTLAFTEDQSAQVIDQGTSATVAMGDQTLYNGGNLTVSFTAGSTAAEDVLAIRNQGTGAGQIGISGGNVTYAGTVIGTYTGGTGGASLVITFNSNATDAAVTALVKNITYQNTNTANPSTSTRSVRFVATNSQGQASANNDVSVTVTAVNDAPVNTVPAAQSVNEDSTLVFSSGNGNLVAISDVDAGGSNVQVTLTVTSGTLTLSGIAGLSFSVGDGTADSTMTFTGTISAINTALAGMGYTPTANYNGAASLSVVTSDLGNTGSGGTLTDSDTVAITVNAVNDAPVGTSTTVTTQEDTAYTFSTGDFGFTDPNDSPANTLLKVKISTLPANGSLTLNGVAVTSGQFVTAADIVSGLLKFTPAANANGAGYTSFTFQVQDNGGTANGGIDLDATARTMTVNVTAVNDAPVGTNKTVTTNEDTAYTFSTSDFGFTDPNDSPANTLLNVKISTLPANGSLTLNGVAVTSGQFVTAADIVSGLLKFTPAANANGAGYTSFTFQVQDNGGTANGGIDLDPTARTMTVNVTAVNDAPVGTNKTVTTNEDTAYTFSTSDFGFTDPNDSPSNTLLNVKITTLPANGSLTLNGVAVTSGQFISSANITSGLLKFTPAANANGAGYTSFTFQVQDNGGTANGGIDLDPTARTMTVSVTAVNDAPAGTNKTVTTNEDTAYTFSTSDFGFTDPNDSPSNTLLNVKISTLPANGSLTLNGVAVTSGQFVTAADIVSGLLKFTPAANANGTGYTSFTFQVQDNGGTANGGIDLDPTARTMTVNVTPVNDAPSGSSRSVTTLENTDYVFSSVDFGFSDANDSPANNLLAVKITTVPGVGSLMLNGVAVNAGDFVLASDINAGKLVFSPALNTNGQNYASLTFQVQDDGGTANGGVDLDATPRTLNINVTQALNSAPQGANNTVVGLEDKPYVFSTTDFGFSDPGNAPPDNLLAVKISTLPTQGSLVLNGVAVNTGDFVLASDIAANRLTFIPASNAHGLGYASFTFQVQDDGGTGGGGVDLDPVARTMTMDITAVNDAPVGTDKTVTMQEESVYTFGAADFGFTDPNDSPANAWAAVKITTIPGNGNLSLNGIAVTSGQLVSAADVNAGLLKFTPAANANGTGYASFTFQVQDDGGTANGGVDLDTTARTMTVDVTPVNDAPAGTNNTVTTNEDTAYAFNTADFGFTDPHDAPANVLLAVKITTTPIAGSLTLNGVAVNAGDFVQASDIAAHKLVFTPTANAHGTGYASFTFQVQDNGGTANGGVDLDTTARTMTVDVTAVNDAPVGTNNAVTTNEDTAYTFSTSDFGFTDPNDSPTNTLQAVKITTTPGAGTLTLNGVAINPGDFVQASDIASGLLKFTPAANANGAGYTSFTFQVQDNGGTANGGIDLDPTARTMTVNVTAVNDAPAGTNKTVTTNEDTAYTFSTSDFGFTDPNDSPANTLLNVKITNVPGAGSLTLNGVAVTSGQFVTAADIVSGLLKFTPAANTNGAGYTSFSFQIQDDGGTANGGVDLDPTARTLTVDVTAVNDAPVGTNKTVTTNEDTAYTFSTSDFGFTDPNDSPANTLLNVKITTLPANGSLTLNGVAVASGQFVSAADITSGLLKFTPATNAHGAGYTSFSFQIQDDGGTANGGVDLDPTARTMTIDVTAVNDAPVGTNKTVTTNEDTAYTFSTNDFGFTDPNDSPANTLLNVKITTVPGAGSLTLNGVVVTSGQFVTAADIVSGLLKFTPAANANGVGYTSFTFQVQDNGGTTNGGVDLDTTARTMTVNVTAVNDAPMGVSTTITTQEDTTYTFSAADFGFNDPNDSPADALLNVKITTAPGAGSLTLNGVAITSGQFVSAADIVSGLLKFTPAANANGAGYASFTFQVQDNGGTANGGVDLDPTARTLTVDVTAVNDAPVGTNKTVTTNEDTAYTFSTSDFGFTDPNDSPTNTLLNVKITTLPANGSLTLNGVNVASGQFISAANITSGLLKFTPAANAHGTGYASFSFQVQDNGGTANGGLDLDTTARTMTVDVTAVNDAPVGTNKTVTTNEDTAYTFSTSDFGFTDPSDTPANTLLAVKITNAPGNGTLTLNGVTINPGDFVQASDIAAGLLKFTPATNANGTGYASFTFQVQDNGGTANGGIDLDATARTMTVNVTAVNDAPVGTNKTVTTNEDTAYTFSTSDFGFTDPNDSPANTLLNVKISTLPANGSLTLNGVAVTSGQFVTAADIVSGLLKFTPAANANGAGYTSFTFQVQDDGGTANGGIDLDPTARTMTVNVTAVNDAPVGTSKTVTTNEDTTYTFSTSDFGFTDPNDSPANTLLNVKISALSANGSLTLNGVAVTSGQFISAANITSGLLKFTPVANANGANYASFSFHVQDNGGTANGGIDLDPTARTLTVDVTPVYDPSVAVVPAAGYDVVEQTSMTLSGTGMSVTNIDAAGGAIQVTLTVTSGTLTASAGSTGTVVSGAGTNQITLIGSQAQINALLDGQQGATLSYINNLDAPPPSDTLTLTVNDPVPSGSVGTTSASAQTSIRITAVNDSPVMSAATLNASASPSVSWANNTLLNGASDPDGDALSVRVVQGPQHGTLTIDGSGQLTYSASSGYTGSDSFIYEAFDGKAASSATRVMNIEVSAPQAPALPVLISTPSSTDNASSNTAGNTTQDNTNSAKPPAEPSATEAKPSSETQAAVKTPPQIKSAEPEGAPATALHERVQGGAWLGGRFAENNATGRQILFTGMSRDYFTTSAWSTNSGNSTVIQLLDLIKPTIERVQDINLMLTPLSSVTHALPAQAAVETTGATHDEGLGQAIRLTKVASYSTGLGLSIGTIWWTARISGLVTSALISTPAWRSLDPLPVVTSPSDDPDHDEDGDSRLGDREVEHLFDGDKPIEQDMPIIQ